MPDYDIFISYASEDRDWVREHLYDPLLRCRTADGRPPRVFFDAGEEGIEVGNDFMDALIQAIFTSRFVVPVYSAVYFDKRPCHWELARSLEFLVTKGHPQLVPVLKDPAAMDRVPLKVSNIEFISADAPGWFPKLAQKFGLVETAERLVLEFLDTPPADVTVNHTLPALRVRARRTVGALPAELNVTVSAEGADLGGTLEVRTEKGVATFADLSPGATIARTEIVATAKGCEPARSSPFGVVEPRTRIEVGPACPVIPVRGTAIFIGPDAGVAVLDHDGVVVFDRHGNRLGGTQPAARRVRRMARADRMLALAEWSGDITAVRDDGAGRHWPLGTRTTGLQVPGDLAIDGDCVVVGYWSGEVYRLPLDGPPVHAFTHPGGIQALSVQPDRIWIAGLDGLLASYDGPRAVPGPALDATVHLLQAYPGCLVAVGEARLYHVRLDSMTLYFEPLPFPGVHAVLDHSPLPVVVDAAGRGIRFDTELVARLRFHARPGAVPVSADDAGQQCVFLNPDGTHALMLGEQVVFTHGGGTLAVSPDGAYAALGDGQGIRILDRAAFEALIRQGAPRA